MKKQILISLIGAPASGKGYIGEKIIHDLMSDYGYQENEIQSISISHLIKQEIQSQSETGKIISEKKDAGLLINNQIINEMLQKALNESDAKIILLDGYPRTTQQVHELEKLENKYNINVIFRDAEPETILERVKNRRVCSICGTTYTAADDDSVCACGGKLIKRKDDENIAVRLAEFEKETKPAIKLLEESGLHFFYVNSHTDGEEAACKILKEIMTAA